LFIRVIPVEILYGTQARKRFQGIKIKARLPVWMTRAATSRQLKSDDRVRTKVVSPVTIDFPKAGNLTFSIEIITIWV
jgi:hypothetical protein